MADSEIVITSAVIIPDEPPASNANTLKRRQSDFDDEESDPHKRVRIEPNHAGEGESGKKDAGRFRAEPESRFAKLQTGKEEERRRGKRMFGALLGVLGKDQSRAGPRLSRQASGSSEQAAQRRVALEKRTQERLNRLNGVQSLSKKERVDMQKRQQERLQWDIDEEMMKVRHDHMLESARYLKTKTEPELYYRPFSLSPADEETVQRQIQDVQDQIDEEYLEFDDRRREAEQRHRDGIKGVSDEPQEAATHTTDLRSAQPLALGKDASSPVDGSRDYLHNGETVVEGEEDTVIY